MLPFIVSGEAAGVLVLHAGERGFFDEEEIKLLRELVGDIAFALDHLEKEQKLAYLAYYDSLTGLANRTLFLERVGQLVHAGAQRPRALALLLTDIERFKTINDSLGRTAGDELLKQVAQRTAKAVGDAGAVARVGADQFAVLLPDIRLEDELARIVEAHTRTVFGQPYRLHATELRVSAKAGIALFPADGDDAETLFKHAEAAVKKAKTSGERYLFYAPQMTARVAEKLALENKLRQGLEKEEFVLHYQPKVDLKTRKIAGVEALIRWRSPELGLVPPVQFIPLLEETGLILEVGSWAMNRASLDHCRWTEARLPAPRIAVNVSSIQLRQRDFVGTVERAIMEGIAPTGIDLEITESVVMEDVQGNIDKLKNVRGLGVRIAIDDFGTGYSSLAYLAKLPVHSLKIDRSFVITMLADPDTMSLFRTVIELAHSLKLTVVAEGVDSEDQANVLRLFGCDEMQGFLYSKPLPFEEMTTLLSPET
ncbi:MAG: EAL domain-containing protein [Betaproteobacteria bacterium]|nr:EAL domain-containing protein [Betaproteobacteria bacterium]